MNPNYQGPFGNTLLHVAAADGDAREVQRLLSAGADPRIRNREGRTPLQVAVMLERSDVLPLLGRPSDAHVEELLDEALKQTFPASDPIAVSAASSRPPRTPR
jgi:ankyrin repeat protein